MSLEGRDRLELLQFLEKQLNVEQKVTTEDLDSLSIIIAAEKLHDWYVKQLFNWSSKTTMVLWERKCLKSQ